MVSTVRPFLMFQGGAEAAINFYRSVFPELEVVSIAHYGPEGPGAEGSVMQAAFTIAGQTIMCVDSPMKHAFTFTPSFSLFVDCESDAEIEGLAAALADGGDLLMPLDNYGFSRRFAWVSDRFGVSWQLNLPG